MRQGRWEVGGGRGEAIKRFSLWAPDSEAHNGNGQHGGGEGQVMKAALRLRKSVSQTDRQAEMPRPGMGLEKGSLGCGLYWSCYSYKSEAKGK